MAEGAGAVLSAMQCRTGCADPVDEMKAAFFGVFSWWVFFFLIGAIMALCTGERSTNRLQCYGTLYKCKQCGNVGCMQNKDHACSDQGFSVLGRCYKCGATGQQEIVAGDPERAPRKTPSFI